MTGEMKMKSTGETGRGASRAAMLAVASYLHPLRPSQPLPLPGGARADSAFGGVVIG